MHLPVDVQLQPTHLLLQLTDHIQNRLQEGRERREGRSALGEPSDTGQSRRAEPGRPAVTAPSRALRRNQKTGVFRACATSSSGLACSRNSPPAAPSSHTRGPALHVGLRGPESSHSGAGPTSGRVPSADARVHTPPPSPNTLSPAHRATRTHAAAAPTPSSPSLPTPSLTPWYLQEPSGLDSCFGKITAPLEATPAQFPTPCASSPTGLPVSTPQTPGIPLQGSKDSGSNGAPR